MTSLTRDHVVYHVVLSRDIMSDLSEDECELVELVMKAKVHIADTESAMTTGSFSTIVGEEVSSA